MQISDSQTQAETLTGTIVYKTMEGGFYAFEAENGKHYTLQGLDNSYRRNGLKVMITGMALPDVMTFTQYGTVFKITSIEVLDDSQVTPPPSDY
ncbi:hypothetical protein [Alteromonas aestuariivivens]|nr:hypothetical protein [Alteromonas aestuariivivens]